MSTASQVAILSPGSRGRARSRATDARAERPVVAVLAFTALALYGVLRWGTLLSPTTTARLLGLLALAVVLAAAGGAVARRSRLAAVVIGLIAFVALFPLAGFPFEWVRHVRIAVTADAIGEGLASLPRADVPYDGINESVRAVILLGAGVLLLDAALVFAFTPRALGDLRRAGVALPLLALAVVPATLVRPGLPYLQGMLLFGLLALFMWGERLPRRGVAAGLLVAAVAALGGLALAPALDQHKPWLDYEALAGTFAPGRLETFNWTQTYAPLKWPQTGMEILDIQSAQAEYWKAENLDTFNGVDWTQPASPSGFDQLLSEYGGVSAATAAQRAQWNQTITVTDRALNTTNVIAAGYAQTPNHLPGVAAGQSPGTWATGTTLGPGDSYTVSVYTPHPSPAQLQSAGAQYPLAASQYLTLTLPPPAGTQTSQRGGVPVTFGAFRSGEPPRGIGAGADASALIKQSPYDHVYALAQRLERSSPTPYAYVKSVLAYLSPAHGFRYQQRPPLTAYPLETFLLHSKQGYCQQFSGAMALLLRMAGIPACVAAGFTTGSHDSATDDYVVTDTDAHDWVEAWFPGYGWVSFDPTPASAPARGGSVPPPAIHGSSGTGGLIPNKRIAGELPATQASTPASGHGGSSNALLIVGLVFAALLGIVALVAVLVHRDSAPTGDDALAELERALRRSGHPVSGGLTLAALEHRFRFSPDAAAYVRALRLSRFAGLDERPTRAQRRAFRAQLGIGRGFAGVLLGWWALPPRWTPRRHLHSQ